MIIKKHSKMLARYIDAVLAEELLKQGYGIVEVPTEDVAPVIHSNWRVENNPIYSPFDSTMDGEVYYCNNCNNKQYKMSIYCPDCGAKMDLFGGYE